MSNSINQINDSNSSNSPAIAPQLAQTSLPQVPDIIIQILMRISARDIGSCSQLCKQWNQLLQKNDTIWANLFHRHFPHEDSTQITNFQAAYQLIHSNLAKAVFASRALQGHTGLVNALVIFKEQLISASNDGTIKIWDLKTDTCTVTLHGHTSGISALKVFREQLISASTDSTIKIWDLKTNTCTTTINCDTSLVMAIEIFEEKLVFASSNGTINVWDLETNSSTTLEGHTTLVVAFKIFREQLISGSFDRTIRIWDLKTTPAQLFLIRRSLCA